MTSRSDRGKKLLNICNDCRGGLALTWSLKSYVGWNLHRVSHENRFLVCFAKKPSQWLRRKLDFHYIFLFLLFFFFYDNKSIGASFKRKVSIWHFRNFVVCFTRSFLRYNTNNDQKYRRPFLESSHVLLTYRFRSYRRNAAILTAG